MRNKKKNLILLILFVWSIPLKIIAQKHLFLKDGKLEVKTSFISTWGNPSYQYPIISNSDSIFIPFDCEIIGRSKLDSVTVVKIKYNDFYVFLYDLDLIQLDVSIKTLKQGNFIGKARYNRDRKKFTISISIVKKDKYLNDKEIVKFCEKAMISY